MHNQKKDCLKNLPPLRRLNIKYKFQNKKYIKHGVQVHEMCFQNGLPKYKKSKLAMAVKVIRLDWRCSLAWYEGLGNTLQGGTCKSMRRLSTILERATMSTSPEGLFYEKIMGILIHTMYGRRHENIWDTFEKYI